MISQVTRTWVLKDSRTFPVNRVQIHLDLCITREEDEAGYAVYVQYTYKYTNELSDTNIQAS